jgi:hypothetical protein
MTACSSRPPGRCPFQANRHIQPSRFFAQNLAGVVKLKGRCLGGGGLCLPEKDPLYPKCISPDLSAILIQKDDAKAQGIRANPRQKNRATWQGQR